VVRHPRWPTGSSGGALAPPASPVGRGLTTHRRINDLARDGALCLAEPGRQYLLYDPDGGKLRLDLGDVADARPLRAEWLDPRSGERMEAGAVSGGGLRTLSAPFPGDAVLVLRADEPVAQ
jgi:hypothetical protein